MSGFWLNMKQVRLSDNCSTRGHDRMWVTSMLDSHLPDDCEISPDQVEGKIRELSEANIDRCVFATLVIFYQSERVYGELPGDHDASLFDLREQATNLILSGVEHTEINQELKKHFPKRPDRTPDWDWDTLRKKAYTRDEYKCCNCRAQGGKVMSNYMHIILSLDQLEGMIGCLTWRRYVGIVITKYTLSCNYEAPVTMHIRLIETRSVSLLSRKIYLKQSRVYPYLIHNGTPLSSRV